MRAIAIRMYAARSTFAFPCVNRSFQSIIPESSRTLNPTDPRSAAISSRVHALICGSPIKRKISRRNWRRCSVW